MKKFKVLFLFCVIAILMIPFSFTTLESDAVSRLDNRALLPMPVNLKGWILYGEDFLQDRIGFRDDILLFYRQASYQLFNVFSHPIYTPGKNGHLYLTSIPALDAYQSIYEDSDPQRITSKLKELYQYLHSRGKHLLFVPMPMKQDIYPEFAPSFIQRSSRPTLSRALENTLASSDVPHLFIKDELRQYRETAPTYYQKFDPAHYNIIGAFVAHEAISNRLKEWYPNYPVPRLDEFVQSTQMENLEEYFLKGTKEEVPVLKRISQDYTLQNYPEGRIHFSVSTNANAPIKKTLFMVGDSYIFDEHVYFSEYGALDFYAHAFEKVYLFPLTYSKNIYTLIERYDPDLIIYEAEEFQLRNADHFGW